MNEHTTPPTDASDAAPSLDAFLAHDTPDGAGRDTLQRLGPDGVERLLRRVEADFGQAMAGIELSGQDIARIAALAHLLATDAGISDQDGRDAMVRLVEIGWIMSRWYDKE